MSDLVIQDIRKCNSCGEIKRLSEFSQNGPYLRSYCRPCANEQNRLHKYRHRYGIEYWQFMEMLQKQDFKCAICKKSIEEKNSAVTDHNPITEKVRALLCSNCNSGLGQFKDSVYLLIRAAEYLIEHED